MVTVYLKKSGVYRATADNGLSLDERIRAVSRSRVYIGTISNNDGDNAETFLEIGAAISSGTIVLVVIKKSTWFPASLEKAETVKIFKHLLEAEEECLKLMDKGEWANGTESIRRKK